jgi:hypothetical protein
MDVAQYASKHRGPWGIALIAGVIAGGVLGWFAHT